MSLDRVQFGDVISKVLYGFSRLERRMCRESGLYYGQPRILTILNKQEGITLSELAEYSGIGISSLSVSMKNMKKANLIYKTGSGKNQKIFLTEIGKEKAACFHQRIDAFFQSCIEQLGEEKSALLFLLMNDYARLIEAYTKEMKNSEIED